ncbi:ABC-2 type transporter, NodJ family [Humidesulfovibrio mexicanus]|uniref:Transport permease protein n=1 Tax=Humidesulfovibrio mexicanus TaxID=147047 RepID=A0A239A5K1_9BACT|nr:ABC transporter permease [Humidesulfovibrio mexicanus]SNR90153.1 ABC-2 type transporter, NodJ family [Humidesulfovibrio mexicanus]
MIRGWSAVYYREALLLRRRLWKTLATMSVSPLLYLLAFGWAMGQHEGGGLGREYLRFLLPGLAAMSSMTQSWAIAGEINIARFYWRIFEEIQAAPVSPGGYVLGEVLAGMTRAFLAVLAVLGLGLAFGIRPGLGPGLWLALGLNAFFFASLAVGLAMRIKSHADQAMLTSFVITPMAFLGGTFFPVERLPDWAQTILLCLPLTHASRAARAAATGTEPPMVSLLVLAACSLAAYAFAVKSVADARD